MNIDGKTYSRSELLKRIGNVCQFGGTRHYELIEGKKRGTRAVDVNTGTGFNFTVIPDRGLDISLASYKGMNLIYQTAAGEVNPAYYNATGMEWMRSFFGGLLTTCGLTYLGAPGCDEGEDLGLHGRYSSTPVTRFCDTSCWKGDEYGIELLGSVEESVLFGDKLRMDRVIRTQAGKRSLTVCDKVENTGSHASPFTILYHINPGFPLLDENAELILSSIKVIPYDEVSKGGTDEFLRFAAPAAGYREQNFHHVMVGDIAGYAYAAIVNRELLGGIGLYIRFKMDSLPYLNEWKMLGEVDYVVGIEPCNTKCMNRSELRREGNLPFLAPGEAREQFVEIGILDGAKEIADFEGLVGSLLR